MYKNLPQSFFKQKKLISMIAVSLLSTTFVFGEDASTVLDKVEISSNGKGSTRQVESVTAAELSQLPPGSSPMLAVSRLPGVNFQSADTFGSYEWSERISVRGFNQNQLGFTLDDIPLGDMSYGNMNGLHISRAIATENISRASLSAGTGSLSVASSSNLGGTLQFYSVDPAKSSGASFNVGGGNLSTAHLFGKLETGKTDLGQAYVSVTDQQSNKWRGSGQDRQLLLNSKYVNEFGSNKLTAFANASDRREIDYQDLSLDMINKFGYGIDNTYPNIAQAVKIANTAGLCGAPSFATYTAACDYQYYAGSGLRQDQLYGATLKSNISEKHKTVHHHFAQLVSLFLPSRLKILLFHFHRYLLIL
jgi:iron complex outermembrane receptor protein